MIKFGTGGWREIIGDKFTKENIQILSASLAQKMIDEKVDTNGFIIGYDRRFLSVQASKWMCEVMAGYGINTKLIIPESPTPLVMFTVKHYRTNYGAIITASHNPAIYNGVKIFTEGGKDASEDVTNNLEQYINAINKADIKTMDYKKAVESGIVMEINPQNDYIDAIIRMINMDAIRARNLRVVIDPMYGVSKTSIQMILSTARCAVDVIHERHDPLFGGRVPTPMAGTLNALINFVLENKLDMGIATDGDADRIGIIDDKGAFLHPNVILALLYYYLLKYKGWHGDVVRNIGTTHLLDKIAEKFNQQCHETPVGFKHISSKMIETYAVIGGESSGGLTVRGHIHGKDGIYASALLVEMIAVTGKKLSELYDDILKEFGNYYMEELGFEFTQSKKEEIYKTLMIDNLLPEFDLEIEKVSYADGCKIYFKNGGWLLARFSGTEPLLRIFCEMSEKQLAQATCEKIKLFLSL